MRVSLHNGSSYGTNFVYKKHVMVDIPIARHYPYTGTPHELEDRILVGTDLVPHFLHASRRGGFVNYSKRTAILPMLQRHSVALCNHRRS